MQYKFSAADFLIGINDSMELDSGQIVASLETDEVRVEIAVRGYVRVLFNDDVYKSASQFPDELLQLFHDGKAYNDERVYIDDNNWFEVSIYTKNPNYNADKRTRSIKWLYDERCDDVIDGEFKSEVDVFTTLMDHYKDYQKMVEGE